VFALLVMIELFRTADTNYPFQHVNRAAKGDSVRANAVAPRVLAQRGAERHSGNKYEAALFPAED
jgi:hypothetical protein